MPRKASSSPVPGGKAEHKSRGKTTGLGVTAFLCNLFEANELSPARKKLTDEQIAIELEREFPDRPSVFCYRSVDSKQTINSRRQSYNRGEYSLNVPPQSASFRYNSKGMKVDGRTGRRVLMPEEIKAVEQAQTARHQAYLKTIK